MIEPGSMADERAEALELLRRAARAAAVDAPEIVLPQDRDLLARGMRFHYLDWGNESKRPILFLHGGGLTAHTFDLVCLGLRADYWCLSMDQRGHGDSEWSPVADYRTPTQADDVAAFVESLGLDGLVVVGMSMGGTNAIQHVGTNGSRIAALVIIDVGPEVQSRGTARIRDFRSEGLEFDSLEELVDRAMLFNPRRDPLTLRRSLLGNLRRTPAGKWAWKWDPRTRSQPLDDAAKAARTQLLWDRVDRIECPTLVIRGAESDVFSPENAAALVLRLSNSKLRVVGGAGHTVQGDNPAGLISEIREFLGQLGL